MSVLDDFVRIRLLTEVETKFSFYQRTGPTMNLKHDDDELNFTIHQPSLYGQTVIKPLTVRAIIDHITKRQRGARTHTLTKGSISHWPDLHGPVAPPNAKLAAVSGED
jgi:hypothetical protein